MNARSTRTLCVVASGIVAVLAGRGARADDDPPSKLAPVSVFEKLAIPYPDIDELLDPLVDPDTGLPVMSLQMDVISSNGSGSGSGAGLSVHGHAGAVPVMASYGTDENAHSSAMAFRAVRIQLGDGCYVAKHGDFVIVHASRLCHVDGGEYKYKEAYGCATPYETHPLGSFQGDGTTKFDAMDFLPVRISATGSGSYFGVDDTTSSWHIGASAIVGFNWSGTKSVGTGANIHGFQGNLVAPVETCLQMPARAQFRKKDSITTVRWVNGDRVFDTYYIYDAQDILQLARTNNLWAFGQAVNELNDGVFRKHEMTHVKKAAVSRWLARRMRCLVDGQEDSNYAAAIKDACLPSVDNLEAEPEGQSTEGWSRASAYLPFSDTWGWGGGTLHLHPSVDHFHMTGIKVPRPKMAGFAP